MSSAHVPQEQILDVWILVYAPYLGEAYNDTVHCVSDVNINVIQNKKLYIPEIICPIPCNRTVAVYVRVLSHKITHIPHPSHAFLWAICL